MDKRASGLWLALAGFACWGLMTPVGKVLFEDLAPFGLNALRFGIAAIAVLLFLGWADAKRSFQFLLRRDVVLVNILANASLTVFMLSLVELDPTFPTLIFYTAPLWTAVFARIWLGERVGGLFIPASALMLLGGYIALFGWATPDGAVSGSGILLALASGILWAVYSVVLRKAAPNLPLRPLMGASFVVAGVYFLALALVFEGPPAIMRLGATTWAWLALYVAVPTLAAFILFNAALQRAPASAVNILVAAELAFTALFSVLIPPGQTFTAIQVGGLVLVMASVTAYLWMQDRRLRGQPSSAAG